MEGLQAKGIKAEYPEDLLAAAVQRGLASSAGGYSAAVAAEHHRMLQSLLPSLNLLNPLSTTSSLLNPLGSLGSLSSPLGSLGSPLGTFGQGLGSLPTFGTLPTLGSGLGGQNPLGLIGSLGGTLTSPLSAMTSMLGSAGLPYTGLVRRLGEEESSVSAPSSSSGSSPMTSAPELPDMLRPRRGRVFGYRDGGAYQSSGNGYNNRNHGYMEMGPMSAGYMDGMYYEPMMAY